MIPTQRAGMVPRPAWIQVVSYSLCFVMIIFHYSKKKKTMRRKEKLNIEKLKQELICFCIPGTFILEEPNDGGIRHDLC